MKSRFMSHLEESQNIMKWEGILIKNNYVLYNSICIKYSEKDKYKEKSLYLKCPLQMGESTHVLGEKNGHKNLHL